MILLPLKERTEISASVPQRCPCMDEPRASAASSRTGMPYFPATSLISGIFAGMAAIASSIKTSLSGMGKFSQLPFPHQDTWTYLRALTDAFGFDACVWGSDWPFLRAGERVDYGLLLKLVEQLFPHREDRRKLLWETPRRLFGFDGAS